MKIITNIASIPNIHNDSGHFFKREILKLLPYYAELQDESELDKFAAWMKYSRRYDNREKILAKKMPSGILDIAANTKSISTIGYRGGVYHTGPHRLEYWRTILKRQNFGFQERYFEVLQSKTIILFEAYDPAEAVDISLDDPLNHATGALEPEMLLHPNVRYVEIYEKKWVDSHLGNSKQESVVEVYLRRSNSNDFSVSCQHFSFIISSPDCFVEFCKNNTIPFVNYTDK